MEIPLGFSCNKGKCIKHEFLFLLMAELRKEKRRDRSVVKIVAKMGRI